MCVRLFVLFGTVSKLVRERERERERERGRERGETVIRETTMWRLFFPVDYRGVYLFIYFIYIDVYVYILLFLFAFITNFSLVSL